MSESDDVNTLRFRHLPYSCYHLVTFHSAKHHVISSNVRRNRVLRAISSWSVSGRFQARKLLFDADSVQSVLMRIRPLSGLLTLFLGLRDGGGHHSLDRSDKRASVVCNYAMWTRARRPRCGEFRSALWCVMGATIAVYVNLRSLPL